MTSEIVTSLAGAKALDALPSPSEKAAQGLLIVDGHVDLPHYAESRNITEPLLYWREGPWTEAKARLVGVRIWGTALYCSDAFNGERAFKRYREVLETARRLLGEIPLIRAQRDLEAFGTFLVLENADFLADRPSYVDELAMEGVIVVGLTHSGGNRLGDGSAVHYSDGLTKHGKEVVRALTARGLLIDVAHLNEKCFWDLMRLYEGPVVSTHTGIRDVCDIPRNIDSLQAREIFQRQGIVGVTVNPEMLTTTGRASPYDVYVHIDTLVQRFGPEGVAIGSDFCGFDMPAEGLEEVAALGSVADLLLNKGYGDVAVREIMGGNWMRLLQKVFQSG